MLRTNTVEKGTLDLIKRFMSDDKFNSFNLVGGTALALKIGHRLSIDIDLFSTSPFNASELGDHLTANYNTEDVETRKNGVFCFVDNVKVDLIAHQYPMVKEPEFIDGIRIASLLDIGAMKLNAIFNSGKRMKDFVDMYTLLETYTLNEMLEACHQKYSDLNMNTVKQSLIRYDEVAFLPIDFVGDEIKWSIITERLMKAFHNPNITFGLPEITKKLMAKKVKPNKGKNRRHKL